MQSILSDHGGLHCPSGKADSCSPFPILSCWFKIFLLGAAAAPKRLGARLVHCKGSLMPRDRLHLGLTAPGEMAEDHQLAIERLDHSGREIISR